jgi:hybrid cluster-associated redox disulfide protein
MAFEISRASLIGELVMNCPVAASVLLEHGFHCIGCGLAAYDTLESGAAIHGLDDAAIDALVREIKDAAKNEEELLSKVDKSIGSANAAKPLAENAPAAKESKKTGKKSKPG